MDNQAQDYIRQKLNNYLESSRLSMGQVAKKIGVSNSMLSQVKNKKKNISFDLSLKILNAIRATSEEKSQLLDLMCSNEDTSLGQDLKNYNESMLLNNELCDLLESDSCALELFIDLIMQKEKGLNQGSILTLYGKKGMQIISMFTSMGIVEYDQFSRARIKEVNAKVIPKKSTLFAFIKNFSDKFKSLDRLNMFDGHISSYVSEIDEEGFEKLKELHIDFAMKADSILHSHQLPRSKGGLRVTLNILTGLLKNRMSIH